MCRVIRPPSPSLSAASVFSLLPGSTLDRAAANRAFAESASIIKGSLILTTTTGAAGSDSISVIHVERILKGTTKEREIAVTHFLCGIEYSLAMKTGRPLLAFVDASFRLVGGTAVLPASPREEAGTSTDARTNLRRELLLAATDEDANTARAAIGALAELDGPPATPTLSQAANRTEFGLRVRALTWLTRFGDANAFDQLAAILAAPPLTPPTIPATVRDDRTAEFLIAHETLAACCGALPSGIQMCP
jgi:hypothetical protein